jgi:hypothetical protein
MSNDLQLIIVVLFFSLMHIINTIKIKNLQKAMLKQYDLVGRVLAEMKEIVIEVKNDKRTKEND